MGCYTWIYRKVDSLSEEYKKSEVEKAITEYSQAYILKVSKEVYVKEKRKYNDSYTEGHYESDLALAKGKIESLKSEGFPYLLMLRRQHCYYEKEVNGTLYYNISFDFPFRIGGSSYKEFTDKNSLLEWAREYSKNYEIKWFDDTVSEWVKGYSEGFEKMIGKFFRENGEDNLYIEFR